MMAAHLLIPTFSFNKTAAPKVTSNGLTWTIADTVVIGTNESDKTKNAVPISSDNVLPTTQVLATITRFMKIPFARSKI